MFHRISFMTLGSVLANYIQKLMKNNHGRHNTADKIKEYYNRCVNWIGFLFSWLRKNFWFTFPIEFIQVQSGG